MLSALPARVRSAFRCYEIVSSYISGAVLLWLLKTIGNAGLGVTTAVSIICRPMEVGFHTNFTCSEPGKQEARHNGKAGRGCRSREGGGPAPPAITAWHDVRGWPVKKR